MRRSVIRLLLPVHGSIVGAIVILLAGYAAAAPPGNVTLASHSRLNATATANGESAFATASADGRYVAFTSTGTDLIPGQVDGNGTTDVFLFERETGTVTLVSHIPASPATTGNRASGYPRVSADGAYVVFYSGADDLVPNQTGPLANIFLFERATGTVTLVSHAPTESNVAGGGAYPLSSISSDATYVTFASSAPNLVPGQTDANNAEDVFVFSRATGNVALVSHLPSSTTTTPAFGGQSPTISADGAFIAFESGATDLVDGQKDGDYYTQDVFLFERTTGVVTLVSHVPGHDKAAANGASSSPAVSAGGGFVAFHSLATDLVARRGDDNGTFDVFLFERSSGTVTLVSHTPGSATTTGANSSHTPAISADGNVVSFTSFAGNLVSGQNDPGDDPDVFMFDRSSRDVKLVSHTPDSLTAAADAQGGDHIGSHSASLSANGGYVAFLSTATNLVAGQTDNPFLHTDVFLFERSTGKVALVSHTPLSAITTGNDSSGLRPGGRGPENETPTVTSNGTVVFVSLATNLVTGQRDTNGTVDVFVFQ